ncbi:Ig-like domain-containing protein [Emticicia sp. 17c]|uniref:Ig-like domain-containing protein n=1 Tax=Emticicia sp. 17c TaxID=3127704 RepID=UPI00301DDF6D
MLQKIHSFLAHKTQASLLGYMCFVAMVAGSCDKVSLSAVSPGGMEENPNDIFYTTKEPITVNPTALKGLETASQISIIQAPKYGEARFTDNGLIYYRFTASTAVGKDNLILRGTIQGGATVDKDVQFNIVASTQDLPCFAGAIGDKIDIEASTATELDITANDKTCATISSLKIEIAPQHGKAVVQGQKIVYTPDQNFVGADTLFYRIGIPNTKNAVAPVELSVIEPKACATGIKDDVLSLANYVLGSDIAIDVLQNDVVCPLYSKATLKIIAQPQYGKVSVDTTSFDNPVLVYRSDKNFTGNDTFSYGLYRDDTHFIQAKVSVSIKP